MTEVKLHQIWGNKHEPDIIGEIVDINLPWVTFRHMRTRDVGLPELIENVLKNCTLIYDVPSIEPAFNVCICESFNLFNFGCKCGYLSKDK